MFSKSSRFGRGTLATFCLTVLSDKYRYSWILVNSYSVMLSLAVGLDKRKKSPERRLFYLASFPAFEFTNPVFEPYAWQPASSLEIYL
jgi:hypothetical protein